jgi:hypothetical protein
MRTKHEWFKIGCLAVALPVTLAVYSGAWADENDPPGRVARLAYEEGSVSLQPGGVDDWVAAPVNRPLTTADKLWSDRDSRAELQLDGSILRLSDQTAVSFLNLNDRTTQVQLTAGTLIVNVRRLDDDETYEIDTPNLAFSILRPGQYRFTVDESGAATTIGVRSGQGEVTGGGTAYPVRAGEQDVFTGTDNLAEQAGPYGQGAGAFDAWSASRDDRWAHSVSAQYVSPDVVGYQDLDNQGTWNSTPDQGYVWFPRAVPAGWAPYQAGHWAYIAPWGYTWVDDQPWGFAPFHYGRWVSVNGAWGWVPARPAPVGVAYVRPVYAPALVAWVGIGAGVAWFALGPREVYVPSYPVSRNYVNNVNVSNTTVNKTVVTNIYNTTIVNNKTVNVTNVNYINRGVPGAVTATTAHAFSNAQPVSRNAVRLDPHVSAPVQPFGPQTVPTRQAVLGSGRPSAARPPAPVLTRAVVARTAPPPPAPSLAHLQQAIQQNGGRPVSVTAAQKIQGPAAAPTAPVRIAPPATLAIAHPPTEHEAARAAPAPVRIAPPAAPAIAHPPTEHETARAAPAPVARPADRPAGTAPQPARPPAAAVHPNEMPATFKPPSPSVANSALERQHLQEQQRLLAQQQEERQHVQQQQELEHQQLAHQTAQKAQKDQGPQQLEQQHQQQTQALLQKHAQQQDQLQQQQQQQRQQQESQTKPASHKGDRPPSVTQ